MNILAEGLTMKRTLLFAVPLAVIAGVIWAYPSSNSAQQITESANQGLDIDPMERAAYRRTTRAFDDHYQRYIGVLDVLRDYPEP
jgi:hypothetical protein